MKTTCAKNTCFKKADTELNTPFCFEHYMDLELMKELWAARNQPVVSLKTRAARPFAKLIRPGVVQISKYTQRQLLT